MRTTFWTRTTYCEILTYPIYMTQKMANLQNAVTRLQIILVSSSYFAYIQRDILELLTLKFSLNTITTQKMARLEDPDRH